VHSLYSGVCAGRRAPVVVRGDMAIRIYMCHLQSTAQHELLKHNAACELFIRLEMYCETCGMYLKLPLLLMMQILARVPFDPSLIVDQVRLRVQVETRRPRKACCETVRLIWKIVPKLQTRIMVLMFGCRRMFQSFMACIKSRDMSRQQCIRSTRMFLPFL
jgi:hypothetical protein